MEAFREFTSNITGLTDERKKIKDAKEGGDGGGDKDKKGKGKGKGKKGK